MTPFRDFYVPRVEEFLGRELSEEEFSVAKEFYKEGWHPRQVADHLIDLLKNEPTDGNKE